MFTMLMVNVDNVGSSCLHEGGIEGGFPLTRGGDQQPEDIGDLRPILT
jgi:hypothetical protein